MSQSLPPPDQELTGQLFQLLLKFMMLPPLTVRSHSSPARAGGGARQHGSGSVNQVMRGKKEQGL